MKKNTTKICAECDKTFHLKGFHPHPSTPDGRMHMCKICHRERLLGTGHVQRANVQRAKKSNVVVKDLILEEIDNRIAVLNRKRNKYVRTGKMTKVTLNNIIDSL